MTPTLKEFSAALLAVLEGAKLTAYQDSGGVWTVGIGHTGPDVHVGLVITPKQQADLFATDQAPLVAMVRDKPLLQAAALVSFGFNCGRGALARVLAGQDTLDNPRHTTDRSGKVLSGLVNRRKLESLLIRAAEASIPQI